MNEMDMNLQMFLFDIVCKVVGESTEEITKVFYIRKSRDGSTVYRFYVEFADKNGRLHRRFLCTCLKNYKRTVVSDLEIVCLYLTDSEIKVVNLLNNLSFHSPK